jgi:hypothetical protein
MKFQRGLTTRYHVARFSPSSILNFYSQFPQFLLMVPCGCPQFACDGLFCLSAKVG